MLDRGSERSVFPVLGFPGSLLQTDDGISVDALKGLAHSFRPKKEGWMAIADG